MGDGKTAAEFPGAGNQYIDISGVSAVWTGQLFSVMFWIRVDAGTWTDGAARNAVSIRVDGSNEFYCGRTIGNNTFKLHELS
jgi:hypothetical protein